MIGSNPGQGCWIILLHWNDPDTVTAAIKRLRSWQSFTPSILVVDNASTKSSWERISTILPAEHIIRSESNIGYGGGNNLGMQQALQKGADFIMLLNADVIVREHVAEQLFERMRVEQNMAILGPAVREMRNDGEHLLVGGRDVGRYQNTRIEVAQNQEQDKGLIESISHLPGMLILIRSSMLEQVGLLDERFFFSGEIADFCQRALHAGYRMAVDPSLVVVHDTALGKPTTRNVLYRYYSLRNRFLYIAKHHAADHLRLRLLWTFRGLRQGLGQLWLGDLSGARSVALAIWHGNLGIWGDQNSSFINGN